MEVGHNTQIPGISLSTNQAKANDLNKGDLETKLDGLIQTLSTNDKITGEVSQETLQSFVYLPKGQKNAVLELLSELDTSLINQGETCNINEILQEIIETVKENRESPPISAASIQSIHNTLGIKNVQASGEKSTEKTGVEKQLEYSINSLSEKPAKSTLKKDGFLVKLLKTGVRQGVKNAINTAATAPLGNLLFYAGDKIFTRLEKSAVKANFQKLTGEKLEKGVNQSEAAQKIMGKLSPEQQQALEKVPVNKQAIVAKELLYLGIENAGDQGKFQEAVDTLLSKYSKPPT